MEDRKEQLKAAMLANLKEALMYQGVKPAATVKSATVKGHKKFQKRAKKKIQPKSKK